jgi:hypothetical protein
LVERKGEKRRTEKEGRIGTREKRGRRKCCCYCCGIVLAEQFDCVVVFF